MFIKPHDTGLLPGYIWQDHAGSSHFALQSKKKPGAITNFFTNLASLNISSDKKSLTDYDFRIILILSSRNKSYVVCVEESFEKIRADWNWVERNLFLKLQNSGTSEQTEANLIRQFEEMTEEVQGTTFLILRSK